jgi:hypothetical protein
MIVRSNISMTAARQALRPPLTPAAPARSPHGRRFALFAAHRLLPTAFRLLPSAFCLLLSAFCLLPTALHAQGCALCYNSASAANAGAREALARGILILFVPPMLFFAAIGVVLYKYRDKFRQQTISSGLRRPT